MSLAKHAIEMHRAGRHVPRRVLVLGERSSGTNYLARLFEENTKLEVVQSPAWKHGFAQMQAIAAETLVVGVVRAPLDWLRSMHAKPWHAEPALQAMEFSEFIRAEWHTHIDRPRLFHGAEGRRIHRVPLQQDRHPLTGRPFANILELRAVKARSLLGYRHRGCHLALLRYELARDRPLGVMNLIAARFGTEPVLEIKPIDERLGSRFKPSVPNRPATPGEIAPADMAFIRSRLDHEVEAELGYALDRDEAMRPSLAKSASHGRP